MRKKLFATGGIVASIFLGASATFVHADSVMPIGKGHLQKTYRDILDEQGIDKDQIEQIVSSAKIHGLKRSTTTDKAYIRTRAPSALVQVQAIALGLSIDQLKQSLQSGQTLAEIIAAQGMTREQYSQNLIVELKDAIKKGSLSGATAKKYSKIIAALQGK